MATKETEIQVMCYELPAFDPANPVGLKGRGTLMKPSPLESFTGRFGRNREKNRARDLLIETGHDVHSINWGQAKDKDKEPCLIVYIWAEGAAPPKPPQKPELPPPRVRRTATSRRSSPRPNTRKKP